MPLTDRFEIIRAEVRNCGTFTTLNSSYFPHIAIFVPQRLGCSKNRPPVRADTLNAALRTFSRGFVLWRFSYAGPECVARSVMSRRPKTITKAVIRRILE
jgi:hypothetical protein